MCMPCLCCAVCGCAHVLCWFRRCSSSYHAYTHTYLAQEFVELKDLTAGVVDMRSKLARAIEERFQHRYSLKKFHDKHTWWLDMAMFLFPPQAKRMEHISCLLRLQFYDSAQHGEMWTVEEIKQAVREKILDAMEKAEEERRARAGQQTSDGATKKGTYSQQSLKTMLHSTIGSKPANNAEDEAFEGMQAHSDDNSNDSSGPSVQLSAREVATAELVQYMLAAAQTTGYPTRTGHKTTYVHPKTQAGWWGNNALLFPLLYQVFLWVCAHLMSSAQIERDFSSASLVLPGNRSCLDGKYFQAQLLALVNFAFLKPPQDMPVTGMTAGQVHAALPEEGFGIPALYGDFPHDREEGDDEDWFCEGDE